MTSKQEEQNQESIIQVDKINLLWCDFKFQEPKESKAFSKFDFSIEADIYLDLIFSKLQVKLLHQSATGQGEFIFQTIDYCLGGFFLAKTSVDVEQLEQFAKMYTLSILWPYAREFASNMMSRSGIPFPTLPIVNAQALTEVLNEKQKIKINKFDRNFISCE